MFTKNFVENRKEVGFDSGSTLPISRLCGARWKVLLPPIAFRIRFWETRKKLLIVYCIKLLCTSLFNFVEVPGFEPGLTEPKSVVLPLHHTSISCSTGGTRTHTDHAVQQIFVPLRLSPPNARCLHSGFT